MNTRIGTYITQKISGASYKAYVPAKLPPEPPIELKTLYPYLEKATLALAELNSIHKTIPNTALFIYMHVQAFRVSLSATRRKISCKKSAVRCWQ